MRKCVAAILVTLAVAPLRVRAAESTIDNPGFCALPRPIHYEMPLAPKDGPKAVIVYGREAPWTRTAAEALQQAIQDWSGVRLELADDRAVTSDDTWLLADAYRKTPLIVLGNLQENRVLHALGTRYLTQCNRSWPGGDRFLIRSIFEPFMADVNYVALEASTAAGMDGAVARFAELLKTFPPEAKAAATIPPRVRVVAGGKDRWDNGRPSWKTPAEWAGLTNASVAELVQAFKGAPILAGTPALNEGLLGDMCNYVIGGIQGPTTYDISLAAQRAHAAMCLLGCRAQGGRTHGNYDHYGALGSVIGIRALFQAGILTDDELTELESCMVLSTAQPLDYVYNTIGGFISGNRHHQAALLSTAHAVDYVLYHCRMDEKTRKEIERRYDGVRKSAAYMVRSFRDSDESDCQGEDTLMQVSTLLHQGLMEVVRNGNLRRSADFFLLSVDNMPGLWGCNGLYVGLGGFSSGPGGIFSAFFGGGLVEEAAFYYDDPQYRWLANNWADIKWSRGGGYLPMFADTVDKTEKPAVPATYDGVRALPYDEAMYAWLTDASIPREEAYRLAPEPYAKAADRLAFRDDFNTNAAYLFLATSSNPRCVKQMQNNMLARFTDLAEIWLFTNVGDNSGWVRSVVSISNGKSYLARAGCTLEALANLGDISAVASKEQGVAGADWTRTIVHWRGHYFVVLDRMEAQSDDEFAYVCRWRCPQMAALQNGVWTAVAPSGGKLRIQNTEPIVQTSEYWPIDGSSRPYVLQQYKRAKLAKGASATYQNLLFVAGAARPDEFESRRIDPNAMLVKGRTAEGEHLALIGVCGRLPLADWETDAAIYDIVGNRLHLAGATTLKARIKGAMEEVFHAEQPVNVLVDCATGQGEVEVRGANPMQVMAGGNWASRKPGREAVTLAAAEVLPKTADTIAALWNRSTPPTAGGPAAAETSAALFQTKPGSASLQRPLKRLTNASIASTPAPNFQRHTQKTWNNTDNLEIAIALPESATLGCLRLVGVNKPVPTVVGRNPTGGEWIGTQGRLYEDNDFTFSLVLSDDNFQRDARKIEHPHVTVEQTSYPPADHSTMQHFVTWRIDIGQAAKQVKLLPRATTKERPRLALHDLEVYGSERVDELQVKAYAADINGDGGNELVVGSSEREMVAYDVDGKQLWAKAYPADILKMTTADLEQDGKAEIVAYLTSEQMHRVNGDGTERAVGDVLQAEKDVNHGCWGVAGASALAVWAPDGADRKEVMMLAEGPYRVLPDGTVKQGAGGNGFGILGCGRLVNLYPGEPEVLALVRGRDVELWSGRRDKDGRNVNLGSKPQVAGPDGGALGWVQQVNAAGLKGFLVAAQGGINYYPAAALPKDAKPQGWEIGTGGVPAVAALAEDINGDGVPEVFLARLDGFVNVLKLADGSSLGLLNTSEPILGMCMLKDRQQGKPCLAVGTRFGVHVFDAALKPLGAQAIPAVAFAGPGGKGRDSVYVVDGAGKVTVLTLK